jgi:putative ABC transport system permease protein
MNGLAQEIPHAVRRLLRAPAFTAAAMLTLALAIGANASIFTVVQRVVLNPLPYPDSRRLIELDHGALTLNLAADLGITSGLYFHYADRARTLEAAAIYRSDDLTVTGRGDPERVRVAHATPSLAAVLGVAPALGRWFGEDEGKPGAAPVAVLSHGLWTRSYGGDPRVIGEFITLEGAPTQVVGVMPQSFAFPDPQVDLWVVEQVTRAAGFGLWTYSGVGRMRDGASLDDVRAELNRLIGELPTAYPDDPFAIGNLQTRLVFAGRLLKDAIIGGVARALWMLLASVAFVLLVACANVANLFLVRSDARQREIAVRRTLGAGRGRIATLFVLESMVLALCGGAVGLGLALGAVQLVVGFAPSNLPRLQEIRLDVVGVAFTFVLSIVAGLVFGAVPLCRPGELAASLHEGGRANPGSRRLSRARHVLMAAQVAVALVLLVSSGLMVRSFQNLRAVDHGFNPASKLTFSIGLPEGDYSSVENVVATHHAILDEIARLPGVTTASASTCLPLSGGCSGNTLRVEGRQYDSRTIPPFALFRAVAANYFEAIGMRVVRGRGIDRHDVDHRQPVVVVNEALARRFFPNENPIGRRVASNIPPSAGPLTWLQIVGVVSNTPTTRVLPEREPMPQLFMPISIAGGPGVAKSALVGPDVAVMHYVVRTATPPHNLLPSVRRAVGNIDANLAVAQARTVEDILDRASAQMAFTMVLLAIAAGVALMLGVVGVYGVMAYIVSQRTAEIGLRLALGAEPRNVSTQIVKQGGLMALTGVALGILTSLAASRAMESLLYGVSPRDPAVLALTSMTLLTAALVACWVPARRAARTSPLEALRSE